MELQETGKDRRPTRRLSSTRSLRGPRTPLPLRAVSLLYLICILSGCLRESEHSAEIEQLEQRIAALEAQVELLSSGRRSSQSMTAAPADSTGSETRESPKAVSPVVFTFDGSEADDPFKGEKQSPVVFMAFSDYACEPCTAFFSNSFPQLERDFIAPGKIKFIYRDFPLPGRVRSRHAAQAAHCAGEQGGYWEAWQALLSEPRLLNDLEQLARRVPGADPQRFASCVRAARYEAEIAADIADGARLGVKGAPGFLLGRRQADGAYSGVLVRGAQPLGVFQRELAKLVESEESAARH